MCKSICIELEEGQSPLIEPIRRGHEEMVQLLLTAPNLNINQKDKSDGATALFIACRDGATECVRHLLKNDSIHIDEIKFNGRTPLFIASFWGYLEIIEMLIQHSNRMKQQKINHGILDVNKCDSQGFPALFVAAQNNHTKIIDLLLKNNVCCNK